MVNSKVKEEFKSFCTINRTLVIPKLIYFFFYGGLSCIQPYLPVYYEHIGLSGYEIGILSSLRPFISFLGAPFWAAISDKFHIHRVVLVSTMFSSIVSRMFILLLGKSFWKLLLLTIFIEFVGGPLHGLINSSVLDLLPNKHDYGKTRLWGANGWGSFSLLIGIIVTYTNNMTYFFYAQLILMMISVFASLKLVVTSHSTTVSFWASFKLLTSNAETFVFFTIVWVMGFASGNNNNFLIEKKGIHGSFLFLFLQQLGASEYLMGLSLTITCIAELPFFFFSGKMINKFGAPGVVALSMFCYAIRLAYYSALWNPWAVLPAELLHGVTYAAFWSACIFYASSIAPPGLGATTQGLLSGMFDGLGPGVGTIVGGVLFEKFGPRVTFGSTSILLVICLILFGILLFLQKRRKQAQFAPLNEEVSSVDDKSLEIPQDMPFTVDPPENVEELEDLSKETKT